MDKQQAAALKTLTTARRLIARKQGWIKGGEAKEITAYRGPNPQENEGKWHGSYTHLPTRNMAYCAYGAIRKADGPGEALAIRLLIQGIRIVRGLAPAKNILKASDRLENIFNFNDNKKRTQDEVLAAFDAAIKMIDVDEEAASNA